MRTLSGAPQFEIRESDGYFPEGAIVIGRANEKLREWAERRRCVRCAYMEKFTIDHYPKFRCNYLGHNFGGNNIYPETFSCAAFEPLSPIETAGGENG